MEFNKPQLIFSGTWADAKKMTYLGGYQRGEYLVNPVLSGIRKVLVRLRL
jgi:hypothetical protein